MERMQLIKDDGGRIAAGFRGSAGDCVVRAVAIATCKPYREVYEDLSIGQATQRLTKGAKRKASARTGVSTRRKWFKDYMRNLGWTWHPTMSIGAGCQVHLAKDELPMGRLIVAVSKHYTVVIDGVIHDTHDPQRTVTTSQDGVLTTRATRCVYGYWQKE